MRIVRLPLVALLLAAMSQAAAVDLRILPADTQWLASFTAGSALGGKTGEWLRAMAAEPAHKPKLDAWIAVTNFDPLRDLESAVLCGSGLAPQAAVFYVEGRFDQQRLVTLVKASKGYTGLSHNSHIVHRWIDERSVSPAYVYASFASPTLLLIGSGMDAVVHSLDAIDGVTPRLAGTSLPPTRPGMMLMAHATGIRAWAGVTPQAALLRNVDRAWFALSELGGDLHLELSLTADNATAAEQIQKLAQGMQALALLGSDTSDPVGKALVMNMKVDYQERTVRILSACPIALLREQQRQQDLLRSLQQLQAPAGR